ncbi:MAG TPA: hypothetical protein VHQ41_01425 [Patescibacteria group bacterium]|nr:hypothetical protein [Patescibacteria group bacterium]
MNNAFELKCPDLNDILKQREDMSAEEFSILERMQVGLNELVNKVRLALAESGVVDVCHYFPDLNRCSNGFTEAMVMEIKRVLEQKNHQVSYRLGKYVNGEHGRELTVQIPVRKVEE